MASHELAPGYEGPKTLEYTIRDTLIEHFTTIGDEFKTLATSEKKGDDGSRELYASVPNIARAENDDQIGLGFMFGYKSKVVDGQPQEYVNIIRVYRYDSNGTIDNNDTRDNKIQLTDLDMALRQESYIPEDLIAKLEAIELDLEQLRESQRHL